MATAPTFVASVQTAWAATTSLSATTASQAVSTGDILVGALASEEYQNGAGVPNCGLLSSSDSASNTWTQQQEVAVNSYAGADISTATASGSASPTFTATRAANSGLSKLHGGTFLVFRGSDGVGASSKTNSTGGPSLSITTTQDNSAIVVVVGDWNAIDGSSRTWRTVNSITPTSGNGYERTYVRDASRGVVYVAYYPDAGTAGSKTVGLSAPTGQQYSIVAVEIKGTAGAAAASLAPNIAQRLMSILIPNF